MKFASYNDGSRDGALVVVSRDLTSAVYATGVATRLQQVLDDWNFLSPQLQDLYDELNHGRARHAFDFDPARCLAPLPRAYQRLQAQAYPEHVVLAQRAAAGATASAGQAGESEAVVSLRRAPLSVRQAASDNLQGARDAIVASREAMAIDFGAQLAVFTADVRHGSNVEQGLDAVRLLALLNTSCLQALAGRADAADDSGSGDMADVLAWPGAAFSPVAVTPDELGEAWRGGKVHLTLQCHWNGRKVGLLEAGVDMSHHFGQIVAQAVQTRHLRAGTIVGSGVVCNRRVEKKGRADWSRGYASIADRRAMELIQDGAAGTGFMQFGDTIRIDMKGLDGHSVFGAIEQEVISWQTHAARTRAAEAPPVSGSESRQAGADLDEDDADA